MLQYLRKNIFIGWNLFIWPVLDYPQQQQLQYLTSNSTWENI